MANIAELIARSEKNSFDDKARDAGFMIAIPGTLYTLSVSKYADVFIEQISDEWTAYRSTYARGKPEAISTKTIASGQTLDYVLMKAKGYFSFMAKMRNKRKRSR